jgi:MFS transporter, OPA family, sugar phosphate sensor protein UhpC
LLQGSVVVFLRKLFKPAEYTEEIQDEAVVKKDYQYWRIRVFYSMFFGYAFYYFTRKSFAFAMPALMQDLHFDKIDLGIISSIWAVSYGLSKFVSGIMGDRSNARYFMSFGLLITGICNILFGFCSSFYLFALFWGLNGWFQGFGWPACARLLTHWYSQTERGRWWGFWNTSHHIGGAVIPIITACFAQYYGWRYAMIIPGSISIIMSFVLMNRLCDTPQSLGLPTIEKFRNDYPSNSSREKERELSVKEILFTYVLNNPFIWILAISYFFIYIIRIAINDWTVLYLVEEKNYSQVQAGASVFWFDIGGIFGSLAAGWGSDKIFGGRRGPINVLFSLAVACALLFFWSSNSVSQIFDMALLGTIGFFIYGPQMLIGMAAAELSHKKAAATASGFTGWVAYLGAAVAGYPMGKVAQEYGWSGFFMTLCACAAMAMLLLLPLWNISSREDKIFKKTEEELPENLEAAPAATSSDT